MELVKLGDVHLTYTALHSLDYGPDGQLYGTMEGHLSGESLNGQLHLTNLAARRGDNVNLPTLRGTLTLHDEVVVWVELDGIATLRDTDGARVFTTTFRCRTGAPSYAWLNTLFGVLEGVLDSVGVGGVARGRLYACQTTIT